MMMEVYEDQGADNALDAFRHAYSSAAMTWDYSAPLAHLAGYANELHGDWFKKQSAEERKMDDWNNAAERRIGSTVTARDDIAQYDDNGDGLIDAEDVIWQQLQVWQDSDSNARSKEFHHALA